MQYSYLYPNDFLPPSQHFRTLKHKYSHKLKLTGFFIFPQNFILNFECFSLVYRKELRSFSKSLHGSFEKYAGKRLPEGVFGHVAGVVLGTVNGVVRGTEDRSNIILSRNKIYAFHRNANHLPRCHKQFWVKINKRGSPRLVLKLVATWLALLHSNIWKE